MPVLKHPMTGAMYTLREDGLVDIENNDRVGTFYFDGRHESGELRHADPHMLLWLAGPQLPDGSDVRKNRPSSPSSQPA